MMHRGVPGQRPYDFIFALYPRHVAYGDVERFVLASVSSFALLLGFIVALTTTPVPTDYDDDYTTTFSTLYIHSS